MGDSTLATAQGETLVLIKEIIQKLTDVLVPWEQTSTASPPTNKPDCPAVVRQIEINLLLLHTREHIGL